MNKPYSTKALPSGTVLREWRLEEVLGVGGFGIVYKGRGIYFDELVAIKEYFPSSISERRNGDTVVPIDSDAEELHALGLKKFVEEAKLLWNLSTPTRHPNIVSVRSLFEIHGTAYMVMDFEDGVSLSRMIKSGKKFTEDDLLGLVRPIGEGLERAHRVGVLHRDTKPPNILMNEDGRPVLIDFGSARFDAGRATSTTVTFHTPPYAAIEQYVKTYEQGPWTDIYALGVVLYECITGEKPPEVLERMHGGLGKNLADGKWPGFSERILRAIDAAMIIRPDDRPQSIGEWLRMFDEDYEGAEPMPLPEMDGDATQIVRIESMPKPIVPVNAPRDGVQQLVNGEPPIPDRTSQASFKMAGEETGAWPKRDKLPPPDGAAKPEEAVEPDPAAESLAALEGGYDIKPEQADRKAANKNDKKKSGVRPLLVAGIGIGAIAIFVGGFFWAQNSVAPPAPTPLAAPVVSAGGIDVAAVSGLSETMLSLADEARNAGAARMLVKPLEDAATELTGNYEALAVLAAEKAGSEVLNAEMSEMRGLADKSLADFAASLLTDAQRRSRNLARSAPWTGPGNAAALKGKGAAERKVAAQLQSSRAALNEAAGRLEAADGFEARLALTRQVLSNYAEFVAAGNQAARLARADVVNDADKTAQTASVANAGDPIASAEFELGAKVKQFEDVLAASREMADRVIAMGNDKKPGSKASDEEKAGWALRRENAARAKDYVAYLEKLSGDIGKVGSVAEANDIVRQANKYKGYLVILLSRSTAAMP